MNANQTTKGMFDILEVYFVLGVSICSFSLFENPLFGITVFFVNGICQVHLSNLAHHATHREISENILINDHISRFLITGPLLLPFESYREAHMVHHECFDTDKDAARREYYDMSRPERNDQRKFIFWIVCGFFGGMLLSSFKRYAAKIFNNKLVLASFDPKPENKSSSSKKLRGLFDVFSVIVSQAAIYYSFFVLTDSWWCYLVFWVLPMFTVMAGIVSLRACLEHADTKQPPDRYLDFSPTWWERIVFSRFEFHNHGSHHQTWKLGIPYHNQKELALASKSLSKNVRIIKLGSYTDRLLYLVRHLPC